MAKRKSATGKAAARKKRSARARTVKKATRQAASAKKTGARRPASARKRAARKPAARRKTGGSAAARARKPVRKAARKKPSVRRPRKSAPKPAAKAVTTRRAAPKPTTSRAVARKPQGRGGTRVKAAPVRQPIPSSLALQQGSSAARSGREELLDHIQEHTETGPAITAGDLDANWELAYSSGDEAPGGDNPTPDQDVVDDIGHALGIEYGPTEELRGATKVEDRDKHRWELDPASAEDYSDRRRK